MKASDLFVAALENEEVEFVFGIPGEETLDLLDSLSRSNIRLILTRHEQAAGFMAATYGRLTGKAGVCLATLGPGATNLVTPAAFAQLGGMPMMMITGQKPVKSSKQGQFQIVDIVDLMDPITKHTHQIVSGANIPFRVREAFRLAEEERPGACHLELPEDIAREEVDGQPLPASLVRRPVAEEKSLVAAVALIKEAKHPLMVIGAAANRRISSKMLRQLIETTHIPFVTTQMGKGVVDERDPRFLGNAAVSSGDFVHRAIEAADLIINVGHDVIEKPPFIMKMGGVRVIHVNFFSARVDAIYFPQVEVVGDIGHSIWQISERVAKPEPHWDFSYFDKVRAAGCAHQREGIEDSRFPIYPQRLVADVRRVMPGDGIIALDNGIYKIWFARNYAAHCPNSVLLDNALASMGAGLPSAMAARLVYPDRKIMAICGDGGFMMNSQELETAIRLKMQLVILILRDDAYGMIKWKQSHLGFENFGLEYGNPDFVKYAESYGAMGHRVEAAEQLVPLMNECHERPGVHVIDVPVDYSENDRILNQEIQERSQLV
jgi:acetolactate synthase I/II/III large subunit